MARERDARGAAGKRPAGSGPRPLRVGEEMRHALSDILTRGEVRDPAVRDATVTVSEVRLSGDLRNAVAYVMPLGGRNAEAVLAGLSRAAPWLRGEVARRMGLKFAPNIEFRLDTSFDEAARITEAIQRAASAAKEGASDDDDGTGA
jgi:ribosome-binding factor A